MSPKRLITIRPFILAETKTTLLVFEAPFSVPTLGNLVQPVEKRETPPPKHKKKAPSLNTL